MGNESWIPTETEQQALHDKYLIDHLVRVFHRGEAPPPSNGRLRIEGSVYAQMRDGWSRQSAR